MAAEGHRGKTIGRGYAVEPGVEIESSERGTESFGSTNVVYCKLRF